MMYFDLKKQERDAAVGYLLGNILHARQACNIPSNEKKFDEDVNIYMAHLLFAFFKFSEKIFYLRFNRVALLIVYKNFIISIPNLLCFFINL